MQVYPLMPLDYHLAGLVVLVLLLLLIASKVREYGLYTQFADHAYLHAFAQCYTRNAHKPAQTLHAPNIQFSLNVCVLTWWQLAGVHALVVPDARPASISDVPRMLLRKGWLGMYGAVFLIFSRDKVGKRDLKRAAAAAAAAATGGTVEREVRLIFVRHGESVWNYVFNRSFGPSFLVRLVTVSI